MKKKFFYLLILLLIQVSVLCACTKKKPKETESTEQTEGSDAADLLPDVIFPEKQFFIHRYGSAVTNDPDQPDASADQTIAMRYFYRGQRPKISVVRLDDPKAEEACKGVTQKSTGASMYRGYTYDELQLNFDFSGLLYGETVTVNSITLLIDGKEQTVDTKGRLVLTRISQEEEDEIAAKPSITAREADVTWYHNSQAGSRVTADVDLWYTSDTDTVVEKLEILDWYQIDSARVQVMYLNQEVVSGKMEELFPLTLTSGQELHIELALRRDSGTPFSICQTNLRLYYRSRWEQEKEHFLRQQLNLIPPQFYGSTDEAAVWLNTDLAPAAVQLAGSIFLEDYKYQEKLVTDALLPDSVYSDEPRAKGLAEFTIPFLYQNTLPEICWEGMNGEAIKQGDRFFVRKRSEEKQEFGSYRVGECVFWLDTSELAPGTTKEIESVRLTVNGIEKTLNVKNRFRIVKTEAEKVTYAGSGGGTEKKCTVLELKPTEHITLKQLEIYGPFKHENVQVEVDGKILGPVGDVFPLTLKSGQQLQILSDYDYNGQSEYTGVVSYSLLYAEDETGEEKIFGFELSVGGLPLSDPKKMNEFIGLVQKTKEE